MTRFHRRAFSDPRQYEMAVRGAIVSGLLTCEPGEFEADLVTLNLDAVKLQTGNETRARTLHVALRGGWRSLAFLSDPLVPSFRLGGSTFRAEDVVLLGRDSDHFQRTFGPLRWATISVLPGYLAQAVKAMSDTDLGDPSTSVWSTPSPERLTRLRRLHEAAMRMACAAEPMLEHLEIRRSLGNSFTFAMAACLAQAGEQHGNRGSRRHQLIMRRFKDWLEVNNHRAVYLQDVCTALGVPARTLARCCEEHLGMSPIHYLWLRRMHLARQELQHPGFPASVTAAAMKFGFWHLGRFAVQYHSLFGEPPSASLARHARPNAKASRGISGIRSSGPRRMDWDTSQTRDPAHAAPRWSKAMRPA